MKEKLVIDGNAVYVLDEECERKKMCKDTDKKEQENDKKRRGS